MIVAIQFFAWFPVLAVFMSFIEHQVHCRLMHKPERRFFSNWSLHKFPGGHHYLHHGYPHKKFNMVLPIADYVLGTIAGASKSDLQAMRRFGLL